MKTVQGAEDSVRPIMVWWLVIQAELFQRRAESKQRENGLERVCGWPVAIATRERMRDSVWVGDDYPESLEERLRGEEAPR